MLPTRSLLKSASCDVHWLAFECSTGHERGRQERRPLRRNGSYITSDGDHVANHSGGHDLGPIQNDARVRDVTAKLITQLFRRMVVKVSCLFE